MTDELTLRQQDVLAVVCGSHETEVRVPASAAAPVRGRDFSPASSSRPFAATMIAPSPGAGNDDVSNVVRQLFAKPASRGSQQGAACGAPRARRSSGGQLERDGARTGRCVRGLTRLTVDVPTVPSRVATQYPLRGTRRSHDLTLGRGDLRCERARVADANVPPPALATQ